MASFVARYIEIVTESLTTNRTYVCTNGHPIIFVSNRFISKGLSTALIAQFCEICGAKVIWRCVECGAQIYGYSSKDTDGIRRIKVPDYCKRCGIAHPWRQIAVAAAVEAMQLELDEQDAATVPDLIKDVATDNPRTQVAATKLKNLLEKMSKPAYDVAVKVLSDIVSEATKTMLGLKIH